MPEQPPTAEVLQQLADSGELVLLQMQPLGPLQLGQEMSLAQLASHWVQLAAIVVQFNLGPESASKLLKVSAATSPSHPQPTAISENLADYWNSVAWRIDQLREWAVNPPE
jgi:hypothetical protein